MWQHEQVNRVGWSSLLFLFTWNKSDRNRSLASGTPAWLSHLLARGLYSEVISIPLTLLEEKVFVADQCRAELPFRWRKWGDLIAGEPFWNHSKLQGLDRWILEQILNRATKYGNRLGVLEERKEGNVLKHYIGEPFPLLNCQTCSLKMFWCD